jgi:hypothetical protein
VGHSAEDLRGMYPQSALAPNECVSHERQAVVPAIPAIIGTVLLGADACGLVLLSFPPSLMRMSIACNQRINLNYSHFLIPVRFVLASVAPLKGESK